MDLDIIYFVMAALVINSYHVTKATLNSTPNEEHSLPHHQHHHGHQYKDQAPTDATFKQRYNNLMRSRNPMFGIMTKYFLRNRAQEHREKRQIRGQPQVYVSQPNQRYQTPNRPSFIPFTDGTTGRYNRYPDPGQYQRANFGYYNSVKPSRKQYNGQSYRRRSQGNQRFNKRNTINERQDNGNTRNSPQGSKKQVRRKFRPSLVQA